MGTFAGMGNTVYCLKCVMQTSCFVDLVWFCPFVPAHLPVHSCAEFFCGKLCRASAERLATDQLVSFGSLVLDLGCVPLPVTVCMILSLLWFKVFKSLPSSSTLTSIVIYPT